MKLCTEDNNFYGLRSTSGQFHWPSVVHDGHLLSLVDIKNIDRAFFLKKGPVGRVYLEAIESQTSFFWEFEASVMVYVGFKDKNKALIMENFSEPGGITRIGPLGKLGRFEPTAEFFCLHCFNQLSKWADPKYYLLVC